MRYFKPVTKFILLFSLFVGLSGCSAETTKKMDPITETPLYGDVKSYTITVYSAKKKFGEVLKDQKERTYVLQYNKKGKIDESITYDNNGSISERKMYQYDDSQNLISEETYNSDGKIMVKYKYDDSGNRIEKTDYNSGGSVYWKTTLKYDNEGNMIHEIGFDSDGNIIWENRYKYDNDGNRIEKAEYYLDENRGKSIYKFDDKGNNTVVAYYNSDDKILNKIAYEYDDKGNIIEESRYNKVGEIVKKYIYDYSELDKYDNWLKGILVDDMDNEDNYIMEREIEYYD